MAEDFRNISDQLKTRKNDRLGAHFNGDESKKLMTHILTSPNDLGVCRNGGRRGTSLGPRAIMSCLKKLGHHDNEKNIGTRHQETKVCDNLLSNNFYEFQKDSTQQIKSALEQEARSVIHIGGGHDHIYPFLKALDKKGKRIIVLNIDAHLDTRTDENPHSGTPFRQFATEAQSDFHLVQIGIHQFANSPSTFDELPSAVMTAFTLDEIQKNTENFSKKMDSFLDEILPDLDEEKDTLVVSLDCDAIDATSMEAVSAVNHDGFPLHAIKEIFEYCRYKSPQKTNYIGIYEYNPIFDNLSQKGARAISSLLYPYF